MLIKIYYYVDVFKCYRGHKTYLIISCLHILCYICLFKSAFKVSRTLRRQIQFLDAESTFLISTA